MIRFRNSIFHPHFRKDSGRGILMQANKVQSIDRIHAESQQNIAVSFSAPPTNINSAASASWKRFIRVLHRCLAVIILLLVDYNVLIWARDSTFWLRHLVIREPFSWNFFPGNGSLLFLKIIPLMYIALIFYEKLYQRRLPFWDNAARLVKICTFASVLTVGILFFSGTSQQFSRLFIGFMWLFSTVYLIAARFIAKRLLVVSGLWRQEVLVIGSNETLDLLSSSFESNSGLGYRIAGVITLDTQEVPSRQYPVLGTLANLEEAVAASGVQEVVLALPQLERTELLELINRVQPLVKSVAIMPDLQGLPLNNLETDFFFDQKTVMLRVRNNLLDVRNRLMKRFFDLFLGITGFVVIFPILFLLALIIKLDSPGPVIHAGYRLGRSGRKFKCYKFRTMYVNEEQILQQHLSEYAAAAEEWHKYAKLRTYDPRVTRVGKWLRRFSMDELPQIFNVIKGDMSIVGPRPYLPTEGEQMGHYQKVIHETTPGITGLWQVSGRNELTFADRLSLESWYVRNWSLWLDVSLLFKTVLALVRRRGAY